MFIGICGSICAGKRTIASYLTEHHGFTHLYLNNPNNSSSSQDDDTTTTTTDSSSSSTALITTTTSSSSPKTTFSTPESLLDHVTCNWQSRFVTTDIPSSQTLSLYTRRPFFLLISVDAPVLTRFKRYSFKTPSSCITLEEFLTLSDQNLYTGPTSLQSLISSATIQLLNTSPSLSHLYATLGNLDLLNPLRLRPSWDAYFMSLASLAAQRSNCMKRRVGCVVIRNNRVISTGYNGTPRGLKNCSEGGCKRCNSNTVALETCLCLHAEENALLEAGRERVTQGAVLYCDTCPCLTCSIKIVQVGIEEVVYSQGYSMDKETAEVFKEGGVRLRQFVPPANGLIHLEKLDFK
ncbi:cytidine deaminase-like protein [Podospora fimiseda]|uniref:Deoxycytidylate deaminase n=1 Tax=Podospora fimiseda TaxID=252190 RepID=A0AAN7GXN6_9PEZI|nr:cytidine deaminase-like protein [Podospora fimiseda]